jgi:hypothetical protein
MAVTAKQGPCRNTDSMITDSWRIRGGGFRRRPAADHLPPPHEKSGGMIAEAMRRF